MSYGWLSESTLIPKEVKKINVDNSSVSLSPQNTLKCLTSENQMVGIKAILEQKRGKKQTPLPTSESRNEIQVAKEQVIVAVSSLKTNFCLFLAQLRCKFLPLFFRAIIDFLSHSSTKLESKSYLSNHKNIIKKFYSAKGKKEQNWKKSRDKN